MQRRKFMQQSLLAGASVLAAQTVAARKNIASTAEKPFNLNYAIHDGTFTNHVGKDFLDQIKFAYDMGFRAVEDNGMKSKEPALQEKSAVYLIN